MSAELSSLRIRGFLSGLRARISPQFKLATNPGLPRQHLAVSAKSASSHIDWATSHHEKPIEAIHVNLLAEMVVSVFLGLLFIAIVIFYVGLSFPADKFDAHF